MAGESIDDILTDDLLERLLACSSPEAYLAEEPVEERSLAEYLTELITAKGITRAQVIRASGINNTFCYQIFQGDRFPGRDTAIKLAFGMRCTLKEAQRVLRLAGVSELWVKQRRDAILIHCLERGLTREQADDELFRLGEETLVGED